MLKVLYLLAFSALSCADVSDVRIEPGLYNPFYYDPNIFIRPPFVQARAGRRGSDFGRNVTLCTYSEISYNKCLHTIHVAADKSIDLPLNCVQRADRDSCIQDVQQRGGSDMVVLQDHDYYTARINNLRPILYAKETPSDYYVAVAPKNISLIEFNEAPLSVDLDIHRAYHSAVLFNLLRGRDICPQFHNTADSVEISIIPSTEYVHSDDDILICLFGGYDATGDVASCNWEVSLPNAVFVPRRLRGNQCKTIHRVFNTIYREFGENGTTNGFNFFDTFEGSDDVIFKKNTERFDQRPTYINGVTEQVFNKLHCRSPAEGETQNVQSFWRNLGRGVLNLGLYLLQ